MSESNRVKLRYSRETTWGETPSGPATTELRATSESLAHEKQTVVSEEMRSDRQKVNVLEVGQSATGDINFELAWSDFEPWLETALRGTIVSTVISHTSTTFAASTLTGADASGLEAGQWCRVDASGASNDDAVFQVASVTTSTITITGTTLAVETASANVVGRTLKNGTTKTSYFVEADFEDLTAVKYFTGLRVDGLSLDIQSNQIITGVFNCQAERGYVASTSLASATTSAGTDLPLTAAANVTEIREGGAILSTAVQGINLSIGNNMRARPRVTSKTTADPADGGLEVTGQLNAYFENITLYDKFVSHTESDLTVRMSDANSNVIICTLPAVHYTGGNPSAGGQDQDVFMPADFTAFRDGTNGYTVRFDFLPA